MKYPDRIEWGEGFVECGVALFSADVDGPEDEFAHTVMKAWEDSFEVRLGSFKTTGDAIGFDEAKRCAEAALRSLVGLNNMLSAAPGLDLLAPLSPRERDIVEYLQRGQRPTEIATSLSLSAHTVRNHLKHINKKLGVRSQVELIALAGGRRG